MYALELQIILIKVKHFSLSCNKTFIASIAGDLNWQEKNDIQSSVKLTGESPIGIINNVPYYTSNYTSHACIYVNVMLIYSNTSSPGQD